MRHIDTRHNFHSFPMVPWEANVSDSVVDFLVIQVGDIATESQMLRCDSENYNGNMRK